jgi:hypothetical protein
MQPLHRKRIFSRLNDLCGRLGTSSSFPSFGQCTHHLAMRGFWHCCLCELHVLFKEICRCSNVRYLSRQASISGRWFTLEWCATCTRTSRLEQRPQLASALATTFCLDINSCRIIRFAMCQNADGQESHSLHFECRRYLWKFVLA